MASPVVLFVGFVAGALTIVSPCILPVLPAVLASGLATGGRRRAAAIASGLAVAFAASALFSIRLLQALGLPLGLRYDVAIVVLFVLAAGFLIPPVGALLERPFARLVRGRGATSSRGGFVLGASLGMLYLPCGGPILATIAAVGSPGGGSLGINAVLLTASYALGIALPMFGLVLATERATAASGWLRGHALAVRRTGGVLLAASAVAITFGAATSLQTHLPSYAASIEQRLTRSGAVANDLARISNGRESQQAKQIQQSIGTPPVVDGKPGVDQVPVLKQSILPKFGAAPEFAKVTAWLNTPDGASLMVHALRGKVVLVDFWTYSCINCLRSLPHVEAWYERYHRDGLVVVGVHTPEFDFEHDVGNVTAAVHRLGVHYPVAIDDDYGTWSAWGNNSWPAEYVIDRDGQVRYGSIGEGDYGVTEATIRALLAGDRPDSVLPPPTSVPDATPTEMLTPETYLGYDRLARYVGTPVAREQSSSYEPATDVPADHLTYGGDWTVEKDDIVAGDGAELRLNASARDIYLVLAGTGSVTGTFAGTPIAALHVAGVPTLYPVVSGARLARGMLDLHVSPGVTAYDFTFG